MRENMDFISARNLLLDLTCPVGTENVPLQEATGRVLAKKLVAEENVPFFDRSPYDGYAFMASDSVTASTETPVTLRILEEIAAGSVPTMSITAGTAAKILTGAPIPQGADAVVMYEKTRFTEDTVTLLQPAKSGDNIVRTGEDVKKGQVLAETGTVIDAGLAGTLASQGIAAPEVFKKPLIGLISTGSEVVEIDSSVPPGKIRNSNRYTLTAALSDIGCETKFFGIAADNAESISRCISEALNVCDAVILTGGVSAGDYDLTPDAMKISGVELLVDGVAIKPGMACTYGIREGKLIYALSGNPASSATNFYAVVMPAIQKLCGKKDTVPQRISLKLKDGFRKKSPSVRILRGKLDITGGEVCMSLSEDQGNVVISSTIGCNVMAIVPAGSGKLDPGTVLEGFLL